MPIDNRTPNLDLPLPNAANALSDDVLRIISSFETVDSAVAARVTTAVMNAAISAAIANLVASSPATLDTLNELATALGNDPNFATTMANSLAAKLDKSGGSLTGLLTLAAAGLQLATGVDPDVDGKITLVSGALKYRRAGNVREIADLGSAQTMTGKTLTSPTINGGTVSAIEAASTIKDSGGANRNIGYLGIPAKAAKTASYQLALTDAFFEIPTNSAVVIPDNASTPFAVETMIMIRNNSASPIGISITTDTLIKEGTGATGARTLGAYGIAVLRKISATEWIIVGGAVT